MSTRWRLHPFGIARLEAGDAEASAIELARKDAALLYYVAREGVVAAAHAAEMLWPGGDPKSALNNCRQRLHRLRKATGARLLDMASTIALASDLQLAPDDVMTRLAEDPQAAIDTLLGSHEYDAEPEFAAWLAAQRQARDDAVADALAGIAARYEREGALALALRCSHRLVVHAPLSEHAHRRLMRLHYLRGDNAAAVAAFEACERQLRDELSARPGAETLALLQTIEQAAPLRRTTLQAPVPVALLRPPRTVGRGHIAHQLAQAHAEGTLPVLVGEAGIGKTRLLQDFIATRPKAVYVQARPSDAGVPYGTLARVVSALATAASLLLDANAGQESAGVVAAAGSSDRGAADPAAAAAPLAAWHAPSTPAQTIDEVAALVAHGAAGGVDTLVIDDLHYADRASVEVLRSVLDHPRASVVRGVFAHRPQPAAGADAGLLDALAEAPQVRWLALAPLAEADVGELLESLGLYDTQRIAPLAAALVRHAGGNPLYIIETMRAMAAAGPAGAAALPRPASIEHLLDQRLQRLSAPALMLARVAAIAGADFSIALAEHALSTPALALADAWAELESADLLRGEAFAHDLIRDAVLRATPAAVARRAHEQVATYCARWGAEPARVAAHWYAAGKGAEAAAAYRQAADRALASGRTREHCELLEAAARSHEMAGDGDAALRARLAISDQLVHVKGPAAGLEHLERLLEQAQTPNQRVSALRAHAHALLWAGRWADAESSARSALALTGEIDPAQQVGAVCMLAHAVSLQGRDDEAVGVLQDAQAAADALPLLGDQADFQGDLTVLLIRVEKPLLAWPQALRLLELVRREGSATRLIVSLVSLFGLTCRRGELARALAWAQEAQALVVSGQEQATALAAHTRTNLGIALCSLARYREGLAALREAAAMWLPGPTPWWLR